MSLDEKEDLKIRLLLRSVYLKGHQDGNLKTTDLSWEDKIVKDIDKLYEKNYLKGVEDGKEMVRKALPTEKEIFNIILNQKPRGLVGNSTGGGTMIDAYPDEYKQARALHARIEKGVKNE